MIPTLILLGPILSLNSVWFAPQEPPAAVQPAPRLGIELAAQAPGANLSMAELEDLLLRRIALSQNGRGALRQLIDLAVLDYLAHERGVTISTAQLGERWAQIEREVIQAGQATSMEAFLEESGVDRPTFRRYLELALIQEVLTRKALGMDPKAEVTAEQQKLWIDSEIQALGYKELPYFWEGGVVAEIGPIRILRSDYARHLREQTDPKELRQACYDALLLKKIRQRMPDLSDEAEARAIDAEMAQRRKDMEQDVRYQGIKYEEILATQGLNLDILRRDPAVIIAALAHVWVDRTCDDDCLRGVYQSEREQFDGRFGEGAETYAIRLTAGQVTNDLVPRTYSEAEAALEALRPDLGDLKAFQRLAAVQTEDIRARESGGLVGYVRTRTPGVDPAIRNAVKAALDAHPGPVQGLLVGPIRLQGSVVLLCLGERALAPTWEVMAQNVHRELRRRFMIEQLPTGNMQTYLDETPMLIAKVVGSVVATQKDEKLENSKLLVCQVYDHKNQPKDQYVIAIDSVGAGEGDMVLYATGSSARQTTLTKDKPCDAVVIGIVDSWDLGGDNVYEKWSSQ